MNQILTERADLFEPNVYIQFLVKIGGKVVEEAMLEAVQIAFETNEATMSKITLDEGGRAYYEKMNKSGCTVEVCHEDWRDLIRKNEKLVFDIANGEMMRVFVLPGNDDMQLLIMAHHLVGDGQSITYFIEDIMKALSGEGGKFKPILFFTEKDMRNQPKLSWKVRLFVFSFNKKWEKKGNLFGWEDYQKIHKCYWEKRSSDIFCHTFSKKETKMLLATAKKMGVSLNSYIITAFLKVHPMYQMIGVPVSVRENNKSMSNQVSGMNVRHRYSDKKSFARNAQQVQQKVHKQLNPRQRFFVLKFIAAMEPSMMDAVLMNTYGLYASDDIDRLARIMSYKGANLRDFGVTNLMKLDIPSEYGSYCIRELLFFPPAVTYSVRNLGVSTINDCLSISLRCMDEEKVKQEQEFFEKGIACMKQIGEEQLVGTN